MCRICLTGDSAEAKLVLLGCDCRGDLQQVHAACAARWYLSRPNGNGRCEVCRAAQPAWVLDPAAVAEADAQRAAVSAEARQARLAASQLLRLPRVPVRDLLAERRARVLMVNLSILLTIVLCLAYEAGAARLGFESHSLIDLLVCTLVASFIINISRARLLARLTWLDTEGRSMAVTLLTILAVATVIAVPGIFNWSIYG